MGKEAWVVVDSYNNIVETVSLELLGEARRIAQAAGWSVAAVLLGTVVTPEIYEKLSRYGAQKIYVAEDERLCHFQSELFTHILTLLARRKGPSLMLMGATPNGNDLASRTAARLGVGFAGDCTDLKLNNHNRLVVTKPIFGGKYQMELSTEGIPQVATVCPDVIGLEQAGPVRTVPVEHISLEQEINTNNTRVLQFIKGNPAEIDITEAEIIVSGGRGIGGTDKWVAVEKLAAAMGGAVAGSRMAKDMGCIPLERLVGQTGKQVKPKLYMALGISGSSHHINGLKEAEKVVVVNNDKEAPFVKQADLAVIADLHEFLPAFHETVKTYMGRKKENGEEI